MIFCMKGGNACPLNCLFCVLSVMIPVSNRFRPHHLPELLLPPPAFDDRQSDIDRITVKNPSKGLCNNTADASRLDSNRRMLSGRTTAEILLCHDQISRLHFFLQTPDQYLPWHVMPALLSSNEFRYLAGIITSVSTLSPYLKTCPCALMPLHLPSPDLQYILQSHSPLPLPEMQDK